MDINKVFQAVTQRGASDLHLCVGLPPIIRLHGDLKHLSDRPLADSDVGGLLKEILTVEQENQIRSGKEMDIAGEIKGAGRFRVHIYRDRKGICAAFRLIPGILQSFEELGLPDAIDKTCWLPNGMVIIAGPAGSGKSTTLASIIDRINHQRSCHIITLEDPIEFIHTHKRAVVNQRQIGTHVRSFSAGLRSALREDPDVILVGEMRDLETIRMAISAAETGHLVFATLHTRDAAQSVNRVIDVFPSQQQEQIRVQLSDSLHMVVSQLLIPARDGGRRYLATEVLMVNSAVRHLIRGKKAYQIKAAIENGKREGMHTFEDSLHYLFRQGKVSEQALRYCHDAAQIVNNLKQKLDQPIESSGYDFN
ncbi:MAG: PilT/PilU family type 4a pilus ATPase [Candidatus Omnitrophica bacterium]|nr:PilT/PilU family type 4a pilus ATPase [Candidatus Omnitrophota bacterium]